MQNIHNKNACSLDVRSILTFGVIKPSIEQAFVFYENTNQYK